MENYVVTNVGQIPRVETTIRFSDRWQNCKARWGLGRMKHTVSPGLYAVGSPSDKSKVFVTANFGTSFDCVRSALSGLNAWIMVLDTQGVNVWCAAGKGTFGTDEIVRRVQTTRLKEIVTHRQLIVPQLGAPGVAAHEVRERSGFRVIYGPVRSTDIPGFLANNMEADRSMRRVSFTFRQRMALVPNDIVQYLKYAAVVALCFLLLSGFRAGDYSIDHVTSSGLASFVIVLVAYVLVHIFTMALLPWLPGRSFSAKGAVLGAGLATLTAWYIYASPLLFPSPFTLVGWVLIILSSSSFVAMNYTGSSTYTSLSGVLKEMKIALPAQVALAAVGLFSWCLGLFV